MVANTIHNQIERNSSVMDRLRATEVNRPTSCIVLNIGEGRAPMQSEMDPETVPCVIVRRVFHDVGAGSPGIAESLSCELLFLAFHFSFLFFFRRDCVDNDMIYIVIRLFRILGPIPGHWFRSGPDARVGVYYSKLPLY